MLVHDAELLGVIDGWVSSLAPDAFATAVPLLRRTFGGFEPAERRQLGRLLADGPPHAESLVDDDLDPGARRGGDAHRPRPARSLPR